MNTDEDQKLTCCDCKASFFFTARDQAFFAEKGFTPPRRCKPCRDLKKASQRDGGGSNSFRSQEGVQRPPGDRPPMQRPFENKPLQQQQSGAQPRQDRPRQDAPFIKPIVQYRTPAVVRTQQPPPQENLNKERRRDSYGERRQKKRDEWESVED